jgi:superfamily II DNA or RNA helicase
MDIVDFLPIYPDLQDSGFNLDIAKMKEFHDLISREDSGKPDGGVLFNHQEMVARFISPYTPYDSLLLYHTPGTGKTCAAIAIAEAFIRNSKSFKEIVVLVPNEVIKTVWINEIARTCTGDKYYDPSSTIRTHKNVFKKYTILTYRTFIKNFVKGKSDKYIIDQFSNSVIIIDEAHNLRAHDLLGGGDIESSAEQADLEISESQVVEPTGNVESLLEPTNDEPTLEPTAVGAREPLPRRKSSRESPVYEDIFRLLSLVQNTKKILLSGTPMVDDAKELNGLLNLILPEIISLDEFTSYLKGTKNINEFKDKIVGRVSYIRHAENAPRVVSVHSGNQFTNHIKTVSLEMHDLQKEAYLKVVAEEASEGALRDSLFRARRQAINCVTGKKMNSMIKGTNKDEKLSNLADHSIFYSYVVKFLDEHPAEPTFIFNDMTAGTGGINAMSYFLSELGYDVFSLLKKTKKSTKPKIAVITGEITPTNRSKIIQIFNSKENRDGSKILAILASDVLAEGVSFTNVRHVIIRPFWNDSHIQQVIARAVRANSLSYLPQQDRVVNVYRVLVFYAGTNAIPDEEVPIGDRRKGAEDNIDIHMYKYTETKDLEIKMMERVLKEVAFDCALNYDRNVVTDGSVDSIDQTDSETAVGARKPLPLENSRECDYTKCKHVCYGVNVSQDDIDNLASKDDSKLIKKSYMAYYSEPQIAMYIATITEYMSDGHHMTRIDDIIEHFDSENKAIFALAVDRMVSQNAIIKDSYGNECVLRHRNNQLFLVRSDQNLEMYEQFRTQPHLLNYYARYPFVNSYKTLDTITNDSILDTALPKITEIVDAIEKDNLDERIIKDMCKELPAEAKIFIVEYMAASAAQTGASNVKFLRMFEDYIFNSGDSDGNKQQTFHTLNRNTVCGAKYYDFVINSKKGSFRCLGGGALGAREPLRRDGGDNTTTDLPPQFEDCKNHGSILTQLNESIADKLEKRNIKVPYGVVQDCTFKIAGPTTVKSGTACSNAKVWPDDKLKKICKDLDPENAEECDVVKTIADKKTKEPTEVLDRQKMCGEVLPKRFKKADKFMDWPA